ncbi:uncharacterized protein LOC142632415 [Castanea sativa]|uniref:uncharacterized protein LOC142632415 n=1 Tax=Castanea sativa TaxID=21020 RepID=UPI003F65393D
MARQKSNLRTRFKSITVEGASTEHVDEEMNQEMHEASTQFMGLQLDNKPPVHVTRGPSKYLEVGDLPDDQVIELPLNSMHQPVDEGARAFTGFLGTIARKPHMCSIKYLDWRDMPEELKEKCWRLVEAWRDHKCTLKIAHYIPYLRNKAQVNSNRPKGCIPEDWDVLVDHWYTEDAMIESEKNRDRHSKQEDLRIASSCSFVVHAAKKAKADGHPVERTTLYSILHTRKDGSTVNEVVQAKMELLAKPSNQLQLDDTSGSIAWASDDVFAKVMGKKRKSRIRGVGFGPSPSGQSSKSALTDLQI